MHLRVEVILTLCDEASCLMKRVCVKRKRAYKHAIDYYTHSPDVRCTRGSVDICLQKLWWTVADGIVVLSYVMDR